MKPTDQKKYFHYENFHPQHWKISIPYSKAHRIRRICPEQEFEGSAKHLKKLFVRQKSLFKLVDNALNRARAQGCNTKINSSKSNTSNHQTSNVVLTYSPNPPNINNTLRRHYNMLAQSERLVNKFENAHPRVI